MKRLVLALVLSILGSAAFAQNPGIITQGTVSANDCVKFVNRSIVTTTGAPCSTGTSFANPTASVGLTAVNGTATTAMRSDAAPALDVTISPTWTGLHTFTPAAAVSPAALIWSGPLASGTNNAAGAWTFKAPLSTGTATNPDLIFQTGVKTTTGASQATPTTALTIKGETQQVQFGPLTTSGTSSVPTIALGASNTGLYNTASDIIDFTVAGTQALRISSNGFFVPTSAGFFELSSGGAYTFGNGTAGADTKDTFITRAGAASLQLGAANSATPVAQTLQAQGSRAGTDNNVAGANLTITSGNGTGSAPPSSLIFQTPVAVAGGTGAQTMTNVLQLNSSGTATTSSVTGAAVITGGLGISGGIYSGAAINISGAVIAQSVQSTGSFAGATTANSFNVTFTSSGAAQSVKPVAINPIYNQPSATSVINSDLFINRTETALGTTPGVQSFIRAQVGGTDKWAVLNTGQLWMPGYYTTAGLLQNDASGNVTTNSTANAATVAATFVANHRLTVVLNGVTYYLPVSTVAW